MFNLIFTTMKFEKFRLNALSKSQMREVKGGGTCGYYNLKSGTVACNVSKSIALAGVADHSDYWCCDSCSTTSYCGNA